MFNSTINCRIIMTQLLWNLLPNAWPCTEKSVERARSFSHRTIKCYSDLRGEFSE